MPSYPLPLPRRGTAFLLHCRGVQSLFRVKLLPASASLAFVISSVRVNGSTLVGACAVPVGLILLSTGFCNIFSACQWKYSCGWMCSAGRPSFVVHWSLEVSLLCATVDYAPLPLQTGGSLPGWCDTALVVV